MTMSSALALVLISSVAAGRVVDAQAPKTWLSNVHPSTSRLAGALRDGQLRSPTLRVLVRQLDATDVRVHLREGDCRGAAVACTMFVAVAAGHRILYVTFELGRDGFLAYRDRLVSQIGHELQHAMEIAREPVVVNPPTMAALYARIGKGKMEARGTQYETEAAIAIGRTVFDEYAGRGKAEVRAAQRLADNTTLPRPD